jgi:hypothetical protein
MLGKQKSNLSGGVEYIKMKRILLLIPAAIIFILAAYIYFNPFIFQPITTVVCQRTDIGCIKDAEIKKNDCIPSSSIIEGNNGIHLMVNITREGDKCVRTEEVVGSETPENSYLTGNNVTCEYDLSQIKNISATACKGSLYEYVVPSGGYGGGGGGYVIPPSQPDTLPQILCGTDDQACKQTATDYIDNCTNYEVVNTELRWGPSGYWTVLIRINRHQDYCSFYYEVLNALNLPPGIPSNIIGSSMTCNIPLSALPFENLAAEWCTGDLYNYLYG